MPKRFTDSEKYKSPFIRTLPGPYKLLWDYINHDCNHAGIWIIDFEIAGIYIGMDMHIDKKEALRIFNREEQRIIELENGKKWFIPSFIELQYPKFDPGIRAVASVIEILVRHKLYDKKNKAFIKPLQKLKDKDTDMELNMERDKEKEKCFSEENLKKDEFSPLPGLKAENIEHMGFLGKVRVFMEKEYNYIFDEKQVWAVRNLGVKIGEKWKRKNPDRGKPDEETKFQAFKHLIENLDDFNRKHNFDLAYINSNFERIYHAAKSQLNGNKEQIISEQTIVNVLNKRQRKREKVPEPGNNH